MKRTPTHHLVRLLVFSFLLTCRFNVQVGAQDDGTAAVDDLSAKSGVTIKQDGIGTEGGHDIDTRNMSPSEINKIKQAAINEGYTVEVRTDSITVKGKSKSGQTIKETTIHLKPGPPATVGSSAADAQNASPDGEHFKGRTDPKTGRTAVNPKTGLPKPTVADILSKPPPSGTDPVPENHPFNKDPSTMSEPELRNLGKTASTVMEAGGVDNPDLKAKADALRNGATPAQAGITDMNEFQNQCKNAAAEAVKNENSQIQNEQNQIKNELNQANDNLKKAQASGDADAIEAAKTQVENTRAKAIDYNSRVQGAQQAAINNGAADAYAEANGFKPTTTPEGGTEYIDPQTGKPVSESTMGERISEGTRINLKTLGKGGAYVPGTLLTKVAKKLGPVGLAIGLADTGMNLYDASKKGTAEVGRTASTEAGKWTGIIIGAEAGAEIGAFFGSALGPLGTAAGGIFGAIYGAVKGAELGGKAGKEVGDKIFGKDGKPVPGSKPETPRVPTLEDFLRIEKIIAGAKPDTTVDGTEGIDISMPNIPEPPGSAEPEGDTQAPEEPKPDEPTGTLGDGRSYWGDGSKENPYTDRGIPGKDTADAEPSSSDQSVSPAGTQGEGAKGEGVTGGEGAPPTDTGVSAPQGETGAGPEETEGVAGGGEGQGTDEGEGVEEGEGPEQGEKPPAGQNTPPGTGPKSGAGIGPGSGQEPPEGEEGPEATSPETGGATPEGETGGGADEGVDTGAPGQEGATTEVTPGTSSQPGGGEVAGGPNSPYADAIRIHGPPTGWLSDGRPYWGDGSKENPFTDYGIPNPTAGVEGPGAEPETTDTPEAPEGEPETGPAKGGTGGAGTGAGTETGTKPGAGTGTGAGNTPGATGPAVTPPTTPPAPTPPVTKGVRKFSDLSEKERGELLGCLCQASLGAAIGVYTAYLPKPTNDGCAPPSYGPCFASGFGCWRSFINLHSEDAAHCLMSFGLTNDYETLKALKKYNQDVEKPLELKINTSKPVGTNGCIHLEHGEKLHVSVDIKGSQPPYHITWMGPYNSKGSVIDNVPEFDYQAMPGDYSLSGPITVAVHGDPDSKYPSEKCESVMICVYTPNKPKAPGPVPPSGPSTQPPPPKPGTPAGGTPTGTSTPPPTSAPGTSGTSGGEQTPTTPGAPGTPVPPGSPAGPASPTTGGTPESPGAPPEKGAGAKPKPPPEDCQLGGYGSGSAESGLSSFVGTGIKNHRISVTVVGKVASGTVSAGSEGIGEARVDLPYQAGAYSVTIKDLNKPECVETKTVDVGGGTEVKGGTPEEPGETSKVSKASCSDCLKIGGSSEGQGSSVTTAGGKTTTSQGGSSTYYADGCEGQKIRITVQGSDGWSGSAEAVNKRAQVTRPIGAQGGVDKVTFENLSIPGCSRTVDIPFGGGAANAGSCDDCLKIGGSSEGSGTGVTDASGKTTVSQGGSATYYVEGCAGQKVRVSVQGSDGWSGSGEAVNKRAQVTRPIGAQSGTDKVTFENLAIPGCSKTVEIPFGGAPATPSNGLQGAEAGFTNAGAVSPATPAALGTFIDTKSQRSAKNTEDALNNMDKNIRIEGAANAANQSVRDANNTLNSAGGAMIGTASKSAATTADTDAKNSFGSQIGSAVVKGVGEGMKSFGTTVGSAGAQKVGDQIFGDRKKAPTPAPAPSSGSSKAAGVRQTPSSGGQTHVDSGGSDKETEPEATSDTKGGDEDAAPACVICGRPAYMEFPGVGWLCHRCEKKGYGTSSGPSTGEEAGPEEPEIMADALCPVCGEMYNPAVGHHCKGAPKPQPPEVTGVRCSICGKMTQDIGGAGFGFTRPDGTKVEEQINDACPSCRDKWQKEMKSRYGQ